MLALAFVWPAWAHKPHVHGEGHLDVAIDGGALTLELRLPLEVVAGSSGRRATTANGKP